MLAQILPGLVMFLLTTLFVTAFSIPITAFPRKNKLINFYWAGFWVFIIMITSISGSMNTLALLDYNSALTANAILSGIVASFVFFVVFAWFRLSFKGLAVIVKHAFRSKAKRPVNPHI